MRFQHTLLGLAFFAIVSSGCGTESALAPERAASQPSSNGSETFVLSSTGDSRLPTPGLEASGATTEDVALLGRLQTAASERNQDAASNPVVFWNSLTTQLGLAAKQPPPLLARSYALVQVGIFDALVASRDHRRGHLPEHAVAAGVATQVLTYLFPQDAAQIEAAAAEQIALDGERTGPVLGAWSMGRAVGRLVVVRGKGDGSSTPFPGPMPTGDGIWTGANPVLPMCGTWEPWIIPSGSHIQPTPPYAFGSAEDMQDVQEVLDVSLQRTPEQIEIVHKWADTPPPTIWNGLLNDRIDALDLDLITSARAHAYLNAAMADAFICCWATKYKYWTARPFQRTPALVTVITTPNFPSYTSGHSTISAAAAAVLGEVFPSQRDYFEGQSEEAAMSRLWGGIHFRQDNEQGTAIGRLVGEQAVERMQSGGRLRLASSE